MVVKPVRGRNVVTLITILKGRGVRLKLIRMENTFLDIMRSVKEVPVIQVFKFDLNSQCKIRSILLLVEGFPWTCNVLQYSIVRRFLRRFFRLMYNIFIDPAY